MPQAAAISTLGRRFPERKGLALSFHGMGGNFGEALAPLVIGALLTVFTWRTVVVANFVPGSYSPPLPMADRVDPFRRLDAMPVRFAAPTRLSGRHAGSPIEAASGRPHQTTNYALVTIRRQSLIGSLLFDAEKAVCHTPNSPPFPAFNGRAMRLSLAPVQNPVCPFQWRCL